MRRMRGGREEGRKGNVDSVELMCYVLGRGFKGGGEGGEEGEREGIPPAEAKLYSSPLT